MCVDYLGVTEGQISTLAHTNILPLKMFQGQSLIIFSWQFLLSMWGTGEQSNTANYACK